LHVNNDAVNSIIVQMQQDACEQLYCHIHM
jgi:hypothetical protein